MPTEGFPQFPRTFVPVWGTFGSHSSGELFKIGLSRLSHPAEVVIWKRQIMLVTERFEVEHVVDAALLLDVGEVGHTEDGVDEHDEEQQQADVEERGERHH